MSSESSATDVDVSQIRGNVSDSAKLKNVQAFRSMTVGDDTPFAFHIGNKINMTEMDVSFHEEAPGRLQARVVCEIWVEKCMLNTVGIIHGGCIAFLVDMCTTTTSLLLDIYEAERGRVKDTGIVALRAVSQSLNVIYHAPAKEGTRLKIVSYTVANGKRTHAARCEIWDTANRRLVASGGQIKTSPSVVPNVPAKL
ncbi:hypothetical protein K439DRAFT_1611583 [Ramaria rubella]|nr:hypothetical protein K439DRAFT_1611583 [Ramaria rubella]